MSLGVIVGRFQIDELHEGHIELIHKVASKSSNVLVLLGCTQSAPNKKNPLDFQTRFMMVRNAIPKATILPILDQKSNDVWSKHLDNLIALAFPFETSVMLYGGRDSFIKSYTGRYKTTTLELGVEHKSSSNSRLAASQQSINSGNFRSGVIYSIYNQYPRVFPTVDVALVDEGHKKVLLGRKANERAFRFPGGFVSPNDTSLEAAAIRELNEETGLGCEGGIEYIVSGQANDWRNSEDGKILTSFFYIPYSFGFPIAADDLEEVKWFDLTENLFEFVVHEHIPLATHLKRFIRFNKRHLEVVNG